MGFSGCKPAATRSRAGGRGIKSAVPRCEAAMTDRPKLLALIALCQDPRKLLEWMGSARADGDREIENAAVRRLASIPAKEQAGGFEDDFRRAMRATSF